MFAVTPNPRATGLFPWSRGATHRQPPGLLRPSVKRGPGTTFRGGLADFGVLSILGKRPAILPTV